MTPVSILDSAAYGRLRKENPQEFVPRSVFFSHEKGSEIDRRNSLWVKAALVYESVTGRHVNDKAKKDATRLLLTLADYCCSRIHPHDPPVTSAQKPGPAVPAPVVSTAKAVLDAATPQLAGEDVGEEKRQESINQGEKQTTEVYDEGSDEKKRVIDSIFLVIGFLPMLTTKAGRARKGAISRDAVDERFKSTHMQDIVTDVIKIENQLPLQHLLDVVGLVEDAIHDAGIAGQFEGLEKCLKDYELGFNRDTFYEVVVRSFCWYYSPFFSEQAATAPPPSDAKMAAATAPPPGDAKMAAATAPPPGDAKMAAATAPPPGDARTLLDYLHASVVPPAAEKNAGNESGGKTSRIPTARELGRSGVRLAPGEVDGRAVVKFNKQSSTLRLPALVYDFKLATVARNLLAREYVEQSKPVTRYFQMMNELVVEPADARILRRAGVVRGGTSGAHEVHELIKKIDGYASYPSVFMAMDVQIERVKQFHDERMQKFLVRYRPGVIWASSLAAISVVAIVAARRNRA